MPAVSTIPQRIHALGTTFKGRMDDWRVESALKHVQRDEIAHALTCLCNHICEQNVTVSYHELHEIFSVCSSSQSYLNSTVVNTLIELTRCRRVPAGVCGTSSA
jgi:tryptophanase